MCVHDRHTERKLSQQCQTLASSSLLASLSASRLSPIRVPPVPPCVTVSLPGTNSTDELFELVSSLGVPPEVACTGVCRPSACCGSVVTVMLFRMFTAPSPQLYRRERLPLLLLQRGEWMKSIKYKCGVPAFCWCLACKTSPFRYSNHGSGSSVQWRLEVLQASSSSVRLFTHIQCTV